MIGNCSWRHIQGFRAGRFQRRGVQTTFSSVQAGRAREPSLCTGGRHSPGQAREEKRVSQRTCGCPGQQQPWLTQAALTHMKSQFIFSSEIRWEEMVTGGRNSSEPGWGGGGNHFLIRALFVDVWVWLAFVHTGVFASVPMLKNAGCVVSEALRSHSAVPGAVPGRASVRAP